MMNKFKISKADSCKSGVYIIRNTVNHKVYVGSAKRLKERFYKHLSLLRNQKHSSKQLQSFVNKHGLECVYFEVLEICGFENILSVEQKYIDQFSPFDRKGFNTLKVAGTPVGYKHSNEAKEKVSKALKGRKHSKESKVNMSVGQRSRNWNMSEKGRMAISKRHKGKTLGEEARLKISKANSGRIHSDKSRKNMSLAHVGKTITESQKKIQSIEMLQRNPFGKLVLNLETGIYYDSGIQAANAHCMHAIGLNRKLRGERNNNTQFILA